ncbi:BrnT family toxin [Cognatishimia sp. D5M38]|uniref:BrnT family toxin n=1 Tax=Cognatishimia coralii TaxID=3083254 RepID=A0ABU8QKR3_9RHOB
MTTLIVWDEPKRLSNIEKHGLDFAVLTEDFFENALIEPSYAGRSIAIGRVNGKLITVAVFRPLGSEALSVISLRAANSRERKRYETK